MKTYTIWEFRTPSSKEVVVAARVSEPFEPQHEYQKILAKVDAETHAEALAKFKE